MKRKILAVCAFLLLPVCGSCSLFPFSQDASSLLQEQTSPLAVLEKVEEDAVAIRVKDVDGEPMLLDVMEYLQEKENFTFVVENGMLTSLNGKANTADFSRCWMLYTSDAELANSEWGTYTYEGVTLGSAIVGANMLPVVKDEVYVWYYASF